MDNRQMLGLLGSLLLFFGVFAPLISVPVMGNINYFQNGKGDGSIILIIAAISFVFTLKRYYRGLWFTSASSLIVMLITFVTFQSKMSELTTKLGNGSNNNFFQGFADMAVQSIQLQWGWALLLAGLALLVATAAMSGDGINTIPPATSPRNMPTINWMPVLVGLGGLVIVFLVAILLNMPESNTSVVTNTPLVAVQTDQTIQQLQEQDAMQTVRQQTLRDAQREADEIKRQAEAAAQQRLNEAAAMKPSIDSNTLNIQPNQGSNQQPLSRETAREELVLFFKQYYAALASNDTATLERLWDMRTPQASKSINIVKKRVKEGIRGNGCSINDAQLRSFNALPTQVTLYIDATCDVDGIKSDRFHSNFDLEKNFLGEWKLLKQSSAK